ncbi:UdgX family uracil-DNA binding protein [Streptomyces orinoci]|uniref:Type-4 uracil-DNA glycosylase n=1 Tax=Streptomyces orinoci TaxID=67339 RepID=A0ABV3JYT5_STRON|nr:UdgX family uracil-DNA binding protein [Streptomyces orinoci]
MAAGGSGGERYDAGPYVPRGADLAGLREAAAGCQGCPLYREASRTVFGSGAASARVLLVGEQPGDQEDRRGEPFVGPAGGVLMRAVDEAGIDPTETYVTNAVKHFKFEPRGKRRIHKAPSLREISACKPWLREELRLVEPEVVVTLGATAGKALLGSSFRVGEQRGVALPLPSLDGAGQDGAERAEGVLVATIHPSAVLRAEDSDRAAMYAGLVADLRVAGRLLR